MDMDIGRSPSSPNPPDAEPVPPSSVRLPVFVERSAETNCERCSDLTARGRAQAFEARLRR
jgi:hypothetical protein